MVIPAKGMKGKDFRIRKAEKVYLLVHNKKSEDKASAYADEIVKKLKAAKIKTEKVPCDWYSIDEINQSRFIAIPEAQKCPESIIEILKTWADDRPAIRKRTDVTIQDIREQRLIPKFVFMCKAVENKRGDAFLDAELERRYMVTHTNHTVKQTEDVIKYKLDTTARPQEDIITMSDEEIEGLKEHIAKCIINRDDTRAVQVRNPCAPFLFDIIPTLFPIARSKVHYFLKLINAVARFYPDEMITM